ncbi:unnamed protein product [Blepharisma stoltei]|uniref:Uncharacterized protein n=1 Tax=Blepharisma stoltei TaxID=1481888 RepID=A0AAU9IP24_9CILI|nr:unnamed protein product [Blepharisma stoltei]
MKPTLSLPNTARSFITEIPEAAKSLNLSPNKESRNRSLMKLKPFISSTQRWLKQRSQSQHDLAARENPDTQKIHRKKSVLDSNSLQLLFQFNYGLNTITDSKLGPGHYYYDLNTFDGPSFHFSTVSRFPQKGLTSITQKLDQSKRQEIYSENKDMKKYLPTVRLNYLKEKAKSESEKILKIKEKKQMIYTKNKMEKIFKLQMKERRAEIKMRKYEVLEISKAWATVFAIFGAVNWVHRTVFAKKRLHWRSNKVLIWLLNLCLAFGKFKRILRRVRIKKSLQILQKLSKKAKKWATDIRKKWAIMAVDVCERVLAEEQMFKMMKSFTDKIIFIQRTMRVIFIRRKSALAIKRLLWNKVEYKMYIEHCVRNHTLPVSELEKPISFAAIEGKSSIPDSIKDITIMNILKKRMGEYRENLKKYKEDCIRTRQGFAKKLYKLEAKAALSHINYKEMNLPNRPQPNYVITENEFRNLINDTIKKRKEWEALIMRRRRTQKFNTSKSHNSR